MKSYPLVTGLVGSFFPATEFEKKAKKKFIFFLEAIIAQLLLFSVALFFGLSPFVYLPTYYLCKRVRSAAAKIVNTQHVFLIDPLVQSSKLLFLKVNKFNRKLLDGFLFQSELHATVLLKSKKIAIWGKSYSLPQKLNSMVFEKKFCTLILAILHLIFFSNVEFSL